MKQTGGHLKELNAGVCLDIHSICAKGAKRIRRRFPWRLTRLIRWQKPSIEQMNFILLYFAGYFTIFFHACSDRSFLSTPICSPEWPRHFKSLLFWHRPTAQPYIYVEFDLLMHRRKVFERWKFLTMSPPWRTLLTWEGHSMLHLVVLCISHISRWGSRYDYGNGEIPPHPT